MLSGSDAFGLLGGLESHHILLIVVVLVAARLVSAGLTWTFAGLARRLPPRWRMALMRAMPLSRFLVAVGAIALIVPLLIEPTSQNLLALFASAGLALAFTLKDYGSSVMAALVTVFERPYQPGDWIEVDKTYGEVKAIGLRAVHVVTSDDTEVIIPHSKLWTTKIFNATSGNHYVLCITDFYLHPRHDAALVRAKLIEIATTSPYLKPDSHVTVMVAEKPWGTHYKLKAYARDSRDQFAFTTDLTIRGKEALLALGVEPALATYAAAAS